MDASVVAAMAKWPNVPHCHGWLSLDRRGQWRLQGRPVAHAGLADFIGRNYERDASGAWYMQNGPQRVWVTLEATPWIYRISQGETLQTHTGKEVTEIRGVWLVDGEALCLQTEWGFGLICDRDLAVFLDHLKTIGGDMPDDALTSGSLELLWAGTTLAVQRCSSAELPILGDFRLQAETAATSSPA